MELWTELLSGQNVFMFFVLYVIGLVSAFEYNHLLPFGHDHPLNLLLDDKRNFVLYYLRWLHGIVVLCREMRLQNHFALILICVETSGVVTVASHGHILHFIENDHLYHGQLVKAIVSHILLPTSGNSLSKFTDNKNQFAFTNGSLSDCYPDSDTKCNESLQTQ